MKSFIAALRSLVLPFGRTSGKRIVLDGDNGRIRVYDASNVLIAEISSDANAVKVYNADGSWAQLSPSLPNDVSFNDAPGLALSRPAGDTEPATITQYDDGFDHGLYYRSSSPVADGIPGQDFAVIQATGRFSTDPRITLQADGPNSFIACNGTLFGPTGEIIGYAGGNTTSYTPVVTGGGTATFTTRVGETLQIGRLRWFRAFVVVNAAGSGGGTVRISTPTEPDRTMAACVGLHATNVFSGGLIANGSAVILPTGSGLVVDALRCTNNSASNQDGTISGADLLATAQIVVSGWYLEV